LSRLDKQLGPGERQKIKEAGGNLHEIAHAIVDALDADRQIEHARQKFEIPAHVQPEESQIEMAAAELIKAAVKPLATVPKLRQLLQDLKKQHEQIIDEVSQDFLLEAGAAPEVRERARQLVQSFESYLVEHKDEIDALQFFYSQPHKHRLRYDDIVALATAIGSPPRNWTPERLWQAYEQLDRSRVRGASSGRLLTDIVSLVKFAMHQEKELVPYAEQVQERFKNWMAQQITAGRKFTEEQSQWLVMIRDHVAQSLELDLDDFDLTPFVEHGGLGRASKLFGKELKGIVRELNEVLAA
jgi:type I restriction enzyme R subunit